MFRKKCPHCSNKISKNYDFCPFCGNDLNAQNDNEDYGFLGKNDDLQKNDPLFGQRPTFLDKLFNQAIKEIPNMMKMMERQMRDVDEFEKTEIPNKLPNNLNIQFFVNGKRVSPEDFSNNPHVHKRRASKRPIKNQISKERMEKIAKLPKIEPASKVRRLSGKIVYELAVPGVKNIEDVFINQLENSIEIQALSKSKFYTKNLNVNLPIKKYKLDKENLILELAER